MNCDQHTKSKAIMKALIFMGVYSLQNFPRLVMLILAVHFS